MIWHNAPVMEIAKKLQTDITVGLNSKKVHEKLEDFGENRLATKPEKKFSQYLPKQLKDIMVIVLLLSFIVMLSVAILNSNPQGFVEALLVLSIVLATVVFCAFQEYKSDNWLFSVQKPEEIYIKVLRDGILTTVPAHLIVPGDIVKLEKGDLIPADGRIFEASSLKCDESTLTGKNISVEKSVNNPVTPTAPLGQRTNMVFSGCKISSGRASVIITATGEDTEIGKISTLLNGDHKVPSASQEQVAHIKKQRSIVTLCVCLFATLWGVIFGFNISEIFYIVASLAIASLPIALPSIMLLVFFIGKKKMNQKGVQIKKLSAIENIGSTSVVLSDKQVSIARENITVTHIWSGMDIEEISKDSLSEAAQALLNMTILCCDDNFSSSKLNSTQTESPIENAIVYVGKQRNICKHDLEVHYPQCGEIPYDTDRRLRTTIHKNGSVYLVVVKGDFEAVLPHCTHGNLVKSQEIHTYMTEKALSVTAVGFKIVEELPSLLVPTLFENDLTLHGMIGMTTPPRSDVQKSISLCEQAGIKPIMITDDSVIAGVALGKALGLTKGEEEAISGLDLAKLSEVELLNNITKYSVYSRITSDDRLRIVKAWQIHGDVVSISGNSVSDAPFLQAADVGCVINSTGTNAAKSVADVILKDNDFSTIMAAIRQGRGIVDKVGKIIDYLLCCSLGEVFYILFVLIVWSENPITIIALLWLKLVTSGTQAFSMIFSPAEDDIMSHNPKHKNTTSTMALSVSMGSMLSFVALIGYYLGTDIVGTPETGKAMAFLVLSMAQLFLSFSISSTKPISFVWIKQNSPMLVCCLMSMLLSILLVALPLLSSLMGFAPLPLFFYGYGVVLGLIPMVFHELYKRFVLPRRKV